MINLDLQDFFHSITYEQVVEVFLTAPFGFRLQVAEIIGRVCTYEGVLPVGAPTSPVLSNFVCRGLDNQLETLAKSQKWSYSRYVDDLSISSSAGWTEDQLDAIINCIRSERFEINPNKITVYGPKDEKVVTGIVVGKKKIDLQAGIFEEADHEIARLREIVHVQNFQGALDTRWVEQFKLHVRGRLTFIGFVLGKRHKRYIELKQRYYSAIHPPEDEFGAVSWRGFQYF